MPGIHRITDLRSQHGAANETACVAGSPNVFCNGLAVQRATLDIFATHGSSPAHTGVASPGSTTVFVNSLPIARFGDLVVSAGDCSSTCIGGSLNVFAGG